MEMMTSKLVVHALRRPVRSCRCFSLPLGLPLPQAEGVGGRVAHDRSVCALTIAALPPPACGRGNSKRRFSSRVPRMRAALVLLLCACGAPVTTPSDAGQPDGGPTCTAGQSPRSGSCILDCNDPLAV